MASARASARRPPAPKADGRDRRQADPVAHHEDVRRPRDRGLRHLPRLQGLHDQGVLRQLLPAHVRRVVRPGRGRDGGASLGNRAVAGDAGRHRRGHDDRRPAQARAPVRRRGGVLLHLRRRRRRRRHQRARRVPPRAAAACATVTAVQPPGRFGALELDGERVREFEEKPRGDGGWTNGGFFVLSPEIGGYVEGDHTVWEQEPMRSARGRGPARRLPSRGLLAGDGHAARPQPARAAVELGHAPWRTWTWPGSLSTQASGASGACW